MSSIVNIIEWNNKIEETFNKAKDKVSSYDNELKIINDVLTKDLNIEEKLALERKRKELSDLIEDLDNDISFGFYVIESQKYISEYIELSKNSNMAISFMKKDRVKNPKMIELTSAFIELVSKYNSILKLDLPCRGAEKKIPIVCHCGNTKDFEIVDKRLYYCLKCGTQIKEHIGNRSTYKDTERANVSNKYKYTRMIHFKNCLKQYQGKQKTRISPQCLIDVISQLSINGIQKDMINPQHVRIALQETGQSDQYENFVLIWSMITHRDCPDISYLEDIIIQDFQVLERTYNEIIGTKEERSSFMSYPYVLYQLLLRRNYKCDLNFFNMLKSDRILWLDSIMEKIYNKLEWTGFTPLG